MPHVALLCEYATLNGGERSILSVLPGLTQRGVRFTAIAPADGPLAERLAVLAVRVAPLCMANPPGRRYSQEELRATLTDELRRLKPDLVHANSLAMGRLVGPVAADLRIPSVAHLRDIVGLSQQAVADLNQNRRLLAVSRADRDYHVAQGVSADKTHVLYNGVDLAEFRPREPTGWLHKELGLPPEALLVGSIGQLVMRKGQDVLAQAAAMIADRYPRVHFVIVGARFSQKPEAIEYEQNVRRTFGTGSLAGRAHFLGVRDDVAEILPELTALVHAAHQEPLGRVLLEAAASGIAVIATDVGGTQEIFPPESQGARLVPPDDAAALATAMIELLDNAPLRRRLGASAAQRARDAFDAETAAAALAEHYGDILARLTEKATNWNPPDGPLQ